MDFALAEWNAVKAGGKQGLSENALQKTV